MKWIALQEVIDDHAEIIHCYGGLHGIRDLGLLASAVDMPKAMIDGKYLHPTLFDKAAAYLYHIVCNHPFIDGNKRTGAITALIFLQQNDVLLRLTKKESFLFEELVVQTAKSETTKAQIAHFFQQCCD